MTATGLLTVARAEQRHAPWEQHLAPKILMAVNYCGDQLAQSLEAAPANQPRIMERASRGSSMTGGMIRAFGVLIGTWNLGSLSGKGGEVCKEHVKNM